MDEIFEYKNHKLSISDTLCSFHSSNAIVVLEVANLFCKAQFLLSVCVSVCFNSPKTLGVQTSGLAQLITLSKLAPKTRLVTS